MNMVNMLVGPFIVTYPLVIKINMQLELPNMIFANIDQKVWCEMFTTIYETIHISLFLIGQELNQNLIILYLQKEKVAT